MDEAATEAKRLAVLMIAALACLVPAGLVGAHPSGFADGPRFFAGDDASGLGFDLLDGGAGLDLRVGGVQGATVTYGALARLTASGGGVVTLIAVEGPGSIRVDLLDHAPRVLTLEAPGQAVQVPAGDYGVRLHVGLPEDAASVTRVLVRAT